ncbi:hypothetical protein [Thermococcus sp. JCM 11816]|uniref:DUF447 family spectrin-like domain-containing protein n=1 Tax=Thermococcus sp. (strain JCM 11816 / KS-1) TaxID=1295125 RepID=UPI003466470E
MSGRTGSGLQRFLNVNSSPEKRLVGNARPIPFSRADCVLVEMAVLFTRYLVKPTLELKNRILDLYALYRHLGGNSEAAEYIVGHLD